MKLSKIYTGLVCIFFLMLMLQVNAQDKPYTLKKPINTKKNTEYAPFVSDNAQQLLFESDRKHARQHRWLLYEALRQADGSWSEPVPIPALTTFGKEIDFLAGPALDIQGNTLYFTASFEDSTQNKDIFFTNKENGQWTAPQNIGTTINTIAYEGFPSMSADGQTLYFIRQNQLLYADADTNNLLEGNVVAKKYKKVDYINQQKMLLEDAICFTIYVAEKLPNGEWGEPMPLPAPINTGCEKAPRIMPDNLTLVFSSARQGGKGGFDLYVTVKDIQGNWSEPKPLDMLNSEKDDLFVTLLENENTLYFNTEKKSLDIVGFSPIPQELQLQYPLLLTGTITDSLSATPIPASLEVRLKDDPEKVLYSIPAPEGKFSLPLRTGYDYSLTASTADENYAPRTEIIALKDATPQKNATSEQNFSLAPQNIPHPLLVKVQTPQDSVAKASGEIALTNFTDPAIEVTLSEAFQEGLYQNTLAKKSKYVLEVKVENYAPFQDTIDTENFGLGDSILIEVVLKPDFKETFEDVGGSITFATNSAEILPESFEALDKIYVILVENPDIQLEIGGHTDDVGDASYNLWLSQLRAASVRNYFVQKGIEATRITEKGYGETSPLVPNTSRKNRRINRRVEFKVQANKE